MGTHKDDEITKDTGEYVVSELARQTLVNHMKYLDVPLAELFKEQVSGNPGFDFYSANNEKTLFLERQNIVHFKMHMEREWNKLIDLLEKNRIFQI